MRVNINNDSLQNQKTAIAEMKDRQAPVVNTLGGNEITALPNVYAGWLDSELMCEVLDIPKGSKVLDLCTGTGVIAIKAAQLGAKNVVAVDLNPEAVKSAILNKNRLGLRQMDPHG
jgi:release factor glutamine methyltransferase